MKTPLEMARIYVEAGYSLVPVLLDGTKKPAVAWKVFQSRKPSDEELLAWFGSKSPYGIALVHGEVSGFSEVIDIESDAAYKEFRQLCEDHGRIGLLLFSTVHVVTPTGGRHLYYRCPDGVDGNLKLARFADKSVKVETRGEGGYTVAPGSPASVHSTGKPYEFADLFDIKTDAGFDVPEITAADRAFLHAMASACNEHVEPEQMHQPRARDGEKLPGARLGDDFNVRGDILPTLLRNGWQEAGRRYGPNGEVIDLTRAGKSLKAGTSATLGYVGTNVLYVFSSNAEPFESGRAYPPFSVFGLLEHGGNFGAATKDLAAQGYGDPVTPSVRVAIKRYEPATDAGEPVPNTDDDDWINEEFGSNENAPTTDEKGFHLTDLGNAKRLIARHGKDLRFCPAMGWLVWNGKYWQVDESGEAVRRMKATALAIFEEAELVNRRAKDTRLPEDKRTELVALGAALFKWAYKSEGARELKNALLLAQSEPGVYVAWEEMDADNWLINCQNGTLNLRTGSIKPHARQNLITKILPVAYEPDATCPTWDKFLSRILPDETVRDYLRRLTGYSLTGDTSDQSIYFLYGKGQNGKSTFLKVVGQLLAGYAMQADSDLLIQSRSERIREDVANLAGKRMVATVEVDDGRVLAEGLVKRLSGEDKIRARFLHKNSFEFEATHKIFLAANHKPVIKGADLAIWRRIKLLAFTVTITDAEKDKQLPLKLKRELAGILAWAVRGCLEYVGADCDLLTPDSVKAQTEEYQQESDLIGLFFTERCVRIPTAKVGASALYDAFVKWSEERHERPKTMTAFGRSLVERNMEKVRDGKGTWYLGIGLCTDDGFGVGCVGLEPSPETPSNAPARSTEFPNNTLTLHNPTQQEEKENNSKEAGTENGEIIEGEI